MSGDALLLSVMRRCAGLAAAATVAIGLLAWAAAIGWGVPWNPRETLLLPGDEFRVAIGAGVEDAEGLRIGAVGDGVTALQLHALGGLHAEQYPFLRYRFDGFPRTLELSLIIHRADGADEGVTVPWPGDGWRTIDLRRVPAWRGEIVEIGFAQYATAQLVPPSAAFQPFRFERAELRSPSWRDGLAALYTSWFGYEPWAFASVNAIGRETYSLLRPPLVNLLVLGGALTLLVAALSIGRIWRSARGVALIAGLIWLLLDWRWLLDFRAKHQLTEDVYAGKTEAQRQRLQPDEDTIVVAERLRDWLSGQPERRLFIGTDATLISFHLAYLLQPHNAGLIEVGWGAKFPADALVLLYATRKLRYDAAAGVITDGGWRYAAEPVFEEAGVHLYRLKGGVPTVAK